jgi:peroxiredoxin Q/BCP
VENSHLLGAFPVVPFTLRLRPYFMPLSLQQQAPDFTLPSTAGNFRLSETFRNKPCILYFYPKDFTPGCTKEACEFRDQFAEFRVLDIDIVGISRDSVNTHLRFKETYRLPFELLADEKGEVSSLYQANILFLPLTRRVTYCLTATTAWRPCTKTCSAPRSTLGQ